MAEKNPAWLPIVRLEPDPIERALRVIWHYEAHPPRISQRYSLTVTEPKEGTDGR
jgi:hypothetical protein